MDWLDFMRCAWEDMIKNLDTREIGKSLAIANEHFQKCWVNKNTNLQVIRREEVINDVNNLSGNRDGYDLLSKKNLKIQAKIRQKTFHLECTRRHSKKNEGRASASGHVAYKVSECDVFLFTIPNLKDPFKSIMVAIPSKTLEDPKNPGFCVRNVGKKIIKQYMGKAKETLESLEKEKSA